MESGVQQRRKILVVEDNPLMGDQLAELVRACGHAPLGPVQSGEEAMELAGRKRPDLILMDIMLSGSMDGVDAAAMIWEMFQVPSIFVTALSDSETVERSTIGSPFGYLIKPVEQKSLAAALTVALARAGPDRTNRQNAVHAAAILASISDAVIAMDGNGLVSFVNPPAAKWISTQPSKAVGLPLDVVLDLVDADGERTIGSMLASVRQSGLPRELPANSRLHTVAGEVPIAGAFAPLQAPAEGVVLTLRPASGAGEIVSEATALARRIRQSAHASESA